MTRWDRVGSSPLNLHYEEPGTSFQQVMVPGSVVFGE